MTSKGWKIRLLFRIYEESGQYLPITDAFIAKGEQNIGSWVAALNSL